MLFRFDKRDQKPNYWQCQPLGAEYQVTKPIRPPPASKLTIFFGCPRQISRWPCHSLSEWVSEVLISASSEHCRLQSCRRHLWPFLQLIRRMRRNVMNNKKTKTDTKTKTKTLRLSDLVTQWHTWLFLTNWGTQIMTLRDFILTVRKWPWQHLQFFRCFEANIVKELFGFWPIAETAKRKEIKKRWLKQCRRLYSFAKSASASASNLLVTCRDVSPPSRPSSNLLSTTFISIRSKSSHCFYKHCNYFGNSPFHC